MKSCMNCSRICRDVRTCVIAVINSCVKACEINRLTWVSKTLHIYGIKAY